MENGTNMKFSYLRVRDDIIIWKNAVMKLHFKRIKYIKKGIKTKMKEYGNEQQQQQKKKTKWIWKKSQIVWLEMKIKIFEIKNIASVK